MKTKLALLVLVISFLLFGCVSIAAPVLVEKGFPPSGTFEILGDAGFGGTRYVILGLIHIGGIEYLDLRNAAIAKYGYVDDVVNVSLDARTFSVLGLFTRVDFTLHGTAILYSSSAR